MRRRAVLVLIGGATVGWSCLTRAQRPATPVIGFLSSTSAEAYATRVAAFHRGLNDAGFTEGHNVVIEYHWAEGQYDRLPAMAADLVRREVSVMVAITTPAAIAAKAATITIPIIFEMGTDPVEVRLIASLNHPGGNLTGVSLLNVELAAKRLELLHEVAPTPTVAAIINPTNRNAEIISRDLREAAHTLGVQLHVLHATTERDLDTVLGTMAELRVGGLVIGSDPFFNTQSQRLASLLLRGGFPAIYQYREFAAAGGLMSYGGDIIEPFHQAGIYTGRVLAGANPGDLPIVQSSRVELIVNLKTAKALGVTVPPSILARADEVIE